LQPLSIWCNADYVEKRVKAIKGAENKLIFEDDSFLEYDILAVNVGSRTRGAMDVKGVWENSLTTRPINELLGKIHRKETELIENKIVPRVVVVGAGAAGVELAFAFKARWSHAFNTDIKVSIIASDNEVLHLECDAVRNEVKRKLAEKSIEVFPNGSVVEITREAIVLKDGRSIPCDVPVWATGAEP
jgi:NADH dehydrogenase FAD-containing subunit